MKKIIIVSILLLSACSNSSSNSVSCDNPKIKGNLTTYNGEKIYHVPSGQFYDVTEAEEMFCTETEAREAGFRKSQR